MTKARISESEGLDVVEARLTALEDEYVYAEYFVEITATTDTISAAAIIGSNAIFVTNAFGDGVDALVGEISSGWPTGEQTLGSGGSILTIDPTTGFILGGAPSGAEATYTLSDSISDPSVALVFRYKQPRSDFDPSKTLAGYTLEDLTAADVLGTANQIVSTNNGNGTVTLSLHSNITTAVSGALQATNNLSDLGTVATARSNLGLSGTSGKLAKWGADSTLGDSGVLSDDGSNATSTGDIKMASGKGMDFTAAGGDVLEYYEEGTYTATITMGTSGTVTLKTTHRTLAYTVAGDMCQIHGAIGIDTVSSPVGSVNLSLPKTSSSLTANASQAFGTMATQFVTMAGINLVYVIQANATTAQIKWQIDASSFTDYSPAASQYFYVHFFYKIA